MEPTLRSENEFSTAGWQVLSALKLPAGSDNHQTIDAWMADALSPLHLPQDFLEKLQKSARDGAARAQESAAGMAVASTADSMRMFAHVHLFIYIPAQRKTDGSSWGFFWMGKSEKAAPGENFPGHVIELYLYREG